MGEEVATWPSVHVVLLADHHHSACECVCRRDGNVYEMWGSAEKWEPVLLYTLLTRIKRLDILTGRKVVNKFVDICTSLFVLVMTRVCVCLCWARE